MFSMDLDSHRQYYRFSTMCKRTPFIFVIFQLKDYIRCIFQISSYGCRLTAFFILMFAIETAWLFDMTNLFRSLQK